MEGTEAMGRSGSREPGGAAASPGTGELLAAEDAGWDEVHALVHRLAPDQIERPGYFEEGWSVKDLLAHLGSWLAEAGRVLEQIRMGTYRPEEIDIDAINAASSS